MHGKTPAAAILAFVFSILPGCRDPVALDVADPISRDEFRDGDTTVLVLGTLHQAHLDHPSYGLDELSRIIGAFDPQAIAVEIRPQDFRRTYYLDEMVMATIQGTAMGIPVHPIDWWGDPAAREQQQEMMESPEYREQRRRARKLERASPLLRDFHSRYGTDEEIGEKADELDATFFNGDDFNRYVKESYRLSAEVWGDSAANLYAPSRHAHMLEAAAGVAAEHVGERIVVLTGAEHKHALDEGLAGVDGVFVTRFDGLVVPPDQPVHPAVRAFLDERDLSLYYDLEDPAAVAEYYTRRVRPLLYEKYDVNEIAEKDVREAARILAAWRETHNPSAGLTRATAELDLHLGRYEQALAGFETSLPALDSAIDDPRELLAARIAVYRRIAICHDLLGDRDQALRAYEAAVDVFEAQGYEGDRRAFWFSWFGIDAMPEPPFTWTRSPAIVVLPGGAESSPDTGDGAAGTTPRPAGRWAEAVVDQNV